MIQKMTPCFWFDGNAEEAMNFYVSVFQNSKIESLSRTGPEGPGPEGSVQVVMAQLEGQQFMALNGGPEFHFTPAISFLVRCDHQAEVDRLWDRLSEGGQPMMCGWLTDKFGVSWQIVPKVLMELIETKDPEKRSRVMKAMMEMVKLDSEKLEQAAEAVNV